ncbi:hypothetical protein [Streptomyces sp. NRRL B-1347]|uniref:hypothetical protein n=1 Tax=Streptomyces sp. NRRL B-1347 TaxID=1476877 RepID=UPI0004CC55F2|nr:hypothetical protein [Streptomyces sp. NRRL B-1347]
MRFRTVAASAALVLCATTAATACSSSSDAKDTTRPAGPAAPEKPTSAEGLKGHIETGKRQAGAPKIGGQDEADATECATSAAEIPEKCALDLSFSESTDGEPGAGSPDEQ